MTEEGSIDQIAEHIRALTEAKPARRPTRLRANLNTIGRLLNAEAVQAEATGESKRLHGVPLEMSKDLPDGEIQVIDGDDEVVRTLRVATGS
jgi:hypothetical protein